MDDRKSGTVRPSWVLVALGLSLSVALQNGFARFAYGLVLPAMQEDLGLSYTAAGWLSTANAIGYLAGSVLTFVALRWIRPVALFRAGLVICTLSLLATAVSTRLDVLSLFRFMAGISGAPIFICSGAIAGELDAQRPGGGSAAVSINYLVGGGIGLLLPGLALPPLLEETGPSGWPAGWIVLGALSGLLVPGAWWACGKVEGAPRAASRATWPWRRFIPISIAYFLFGLGYIGYITFVFAWARQQGSGALSVTLLSVVLGITTMASSIVMAPVVSRARSGGATALAMAMLSVATLLVLHRSGQWTLYASALLYGLGMFMVPTTIAALVRSTLPHASWSVALAVLTTAFSCGQIAGPVITGFISDTFGTLEVGLMASAVVLALGSAIAFSQPLATVKE